MKKLLSSLLIMGFLVSNFTGLQVNAAEINVEQNSEAETVTSAAENDINEKYSQQTEKEEINLDKKVESEEETDIIQNDEDETINSDEELDIEDIQQEDQNYDADKFNIENQTKPETKESEEVINEQLIENEIHIDENEKDSSARVAADSEKPVIDTSSIWIDNTSVYYGDTVTIRVKVTDNDEMDRVFIGLSNNTSSKTISEYMSYNKTTELYEITINMDNTLPSGVWNVSYIMAYDKTGNNESSFFDNTNYFFSLINNIDSENPIIDKNSFYKDKETVNYGESINFRVKATDNVEINQVNISLENSTSLFSITRNMEYNSDSKYYEYTLTIDEDIPEGNWKVTHIHVNDKTHNYTILFLEEEYFTVINPNTDSEPPYINISSIKINNLNPITDDIVNIQIKLTDNVAIAYATISFNNLDTNQSITSKDLEYNSSSDLYEYSFKIDDTITVGHWDFWIYVRDSIGNYSIEFFNNSDYTFIITDHGEDIHDWDEGVITKSPTKTEEGIKTYTCKLWACGITKTESIPATGETDIEDNTNNDTGDNINSGSNNTETDSNTGDNTNNNNIPSIPSFWIPTTEEEQLRYSCFGKENIQYTTSNNQPFNIDIQNAMQGKNCYEVFKNIAGDYTIARTYNIYPIGTELKYSTEDKITVSLTIPEILRKENREFKMICVSQNGVPYVYADQDKNSDTITFDTDKFYAFALVYKDIK